MNFIKHLATGTSVLVAIAGTAAAQTTSCEPVDLTIYFADSDAALSSHAQAALNAEIEAMRDCDVMTIESYASSGEAESSTAALALSNARTRSVLNALHSSGVVVPDDQITIHYETKDAGWTAISRRVEMTLVTRPRRPTT